MFMNIFNLTVKGLKLQMYDMICIALRLLYAVSGLNFHFLKAVNLIYILIVILQLIPGGNAMFRKNIKSRDE